MSVVPLHILLCTKKFNLHIPDLIYSESNTLAYEQGHLCECSGKTFWRLCCQTARKSEPANRLLIFELRPFQGVKILSNRIKANVIKLTGSCMCRCASGVKSGQKQTPKTSFCMKRTTFILSRGKSMICSVQIKEFPIALPTH